jgi:hypothetical protein
MSNAILILEVHLEKLKEAYHQYVVIGGVGKDSETAKINLKTQHELRKAIEILNKHK